MSYEIEKAQEEADRNEGEHEYFKARPQADTNHNRHLFCAGFDRGHQAGRQAARQQAVPSDTAKRRALLFLDGLQQDGCNEVKTLRSLLAAAPQAEHVNDTGVVELRQAEQAVEPAVWRCPRRDANDDWVYDYSRRKVCDYCEPLFTAPPTPDVSGLVNIRKAFESCAARIFKGWSIGRVMTRAGGNSWNGTSYTNAETDLAWELFQEAFAIGINQPPILSDASALVARDWEMKAKGVEGVIHLVVSKHDQDVLRQYARDMRIESEHIAAAHRSNSHE